MAIKKISLLLALLAALFVKTQAQEMNNYADNWKKVDGFDRKGLTASALKEVLIIFNKAVADKNDPQQIKAAIYQIRYRNMVEEYNGPKNIFFIDTLVTKSTAPVKNILESMQAEILWNYKNRNRYRLYNRTQLAEEKSDDISTWSLEKLKSRITELYTASLKNTTVIKNTSLNGWDAMLAKGSNTRNLRPSLFDFLAHRALRYFTNTENDVTNPAYKFILNDETLFAPADSFINIKFATKDTQSLYYHALQLYQDILRFHLKDENPEALIDADLLRLDFVNKYAVLSNKNKLYEQALQSIQTNYSNNAAAAQAIFLQAQLYFQSGNSFDPFTKSNVQFDLKKAKELCELAIQQFPESEGALKAKNLIQAIQAPQLKLETEKINIPGEPFRSLVNYKNTKTIYLRVIKTTRDEIKKIQLAGYDKSWQMIAGLTALKNWSVSLPQLNDYQEHSTEIKIEALEPGIYYILASLSPDFTTTNNILSSQTTYVSNISFINNNKNEYYILDRDNGKPLAGATLQVWEQKYNYSNSSYEEVKGTKYTANGYGYIKIKKKKENTYNNYYQVNYKDDELFTDDSYYNYDYNYNNNRDKFTKRTFLFTDRSIYRPGQTVYFKGIVVNTDNNTRKSDIIPAFKTNIRLTDVNGELVNNLKLTTNEFGSYNGSFKLPENLLNGSFSIADSLTNSEISFNVEEYKRPKFQVEIKKPAGTYRVNDSIEVKGTAKAYAGNNIDGAKVTYRVTRKVEYPVWWGWGRGMSWLPYNQNPAMEITNGETITDASGAFSIIFKAIPDESVNKAAQPTFNYEITTDITDLNGETRNGNTNVAVAYQAIKLNILAADNIPVDSIHTIKISSRNMNDLYEKANVQLQFLQLQSPGKIFRDRMWEMPDQFVMSKEDFTKSFPYDIYADENQMSKWPVIDSISITDTTSDNNHFNLTQKPSAQGWYKLVATTTDKYGEDVRAEKYIYISGKSRQEIDKPVLLTAQKEMLQPGEKLKYTIETGFDNVQLIHSVSKMQNLTAIDYPVINNKQPFSNEMNITENDRGGLEITCAFVKHNRFYTVVKTIAIPWDNKDLKITYETFRDKVLPGSEEKWKIKISGSQAEKVAAEALINMYDASLDQFMPHNWNALQSLWPRLNEFTRWSTNLFSKVISSNQNSIKNNRISIKSKIYDRLLANGWSEGDYEYDSREDVVYSWSASANMMTASGALETERNGYDYDDGKSARHTKKPKQVGEVKMVMFAPPKVVKDEEVSADERIETIKSDVDENPLAANNNIQIRKNFNENAFFFPSLYTDANGNIEFSFTMPEALTSWKMMTLAHDKSLASAYSEKTVITQKPLMVQPNAPRFVREADRMELSAKIINLSDSEVTGTAQLELLDALTNKPVDGWFKNIFPVQYFTAAAGQSAAIKFPIDIPLNFNSALIYRIKAATKDGAASDGEEAAIPVLTNRTLVTETLPLNMRQENTKHFSFNKLKNSSNSNTLSHQSLTVEYTSNPAWYAVQALPYLMEYPYECAEQSFNRYYANTLASYVTNSSPKIKAVFEKWKTTDTAALLSNLQKNEALKSALLQETPWVLAAKDESKQKQQIALLFDMVKLAAEKQKTFNKLKELQTPNGSFSWFKGGPDDRYMTQYIITGIGHLKKLNALSSPDEEQLKPIVKQALPWLDLQLKKEYDELKRLKMDMKLNHLSYTAIQYLYMRSFFKEESIAKEIQPVVDYYLNQCDKYWLKQSKYMQAMMALALHRNNHALTSKGIIASLKENAIYNDEMGMYFKEFSTGGCYWYQSPIESQAMMIEAFSEVDKNNKSVDDLKTWLLKQKQTQNWKTTKATAEACYALLMNGSNWLNQERQVEIHLGNTVINSKDEKNEAGTGYFKKTIDGSKVNTDMGDIAVTITAAANNAPTTSWGAVYWQYFEDLDKITSAETPLKLVKKLFIEKNSDTGPVLVALNDGDELHVGDKVKVRIELRADRDMEYIHMKDMRAACMEPVNVISEYKWQGGLGYYESTKDASTNFFFGWLPKGTYVFEYPVFVTHDGNFSNGITTIQSMYAPEFSSHSEGIRVNVSGK